MLAWLVRYALFALGAPDAVDVDAHRSASACMARATTSSTWPVRSTSIRKASPRIRAQAQGLFVLATYGIGQGLGTLAAGWIFNAIMPATGGAGSLEQWQMFWMFPLIFALIVTALFMSASATRCQRGVQPQRTSGRLATSD